MKPIEVENVGVVNIFGKSFLGQQKIGKTPFSAINAIFAYFVIQFINNSFTIKKKRLKGF